ncbi:MAG: TRAP transporter fused permease subunit, partial [Desulfatiglandales bacterium]|nr:TRAP transporter fused permease subunit [Desulfatiglandales bacterium]
VLLGVVLVFLLYTFLGFLLPAPFATMKYSFGKLISKLTMIQGLYGIILGISANYLFLFVTFGSVLQISGATRFFMQIGKLLGRSGLAGGAALTAVISSALLGTLTGSVSANVVTSGSYSIPLMKKAGYRAEQAAAIEAAASTGGQIMPPIMGAGAFVMAGITGIPYLEIIVAAIIPAILYFVVVGVYAQLQAMKLGIRPLPEKIDIKEMLLTSYLFMVPIGILVILLVVGYTPMYVIFWTIISVVALSMFRKETRPSLMQWVEGFRNGAILGAQIGVSCAVIGLIVSCITLTGLGLKVPGLVEAISGGSMVIALLLTAGAALILGCGMPTVAVYIMVVTVIAPVLVKMGLPLLTAHFFAFYFACMNFVTLPVAIGALIASKVAGANFTRTGIESMKAALGGFIVPFLMILAPVLMLQGQGSPSGVVIITQVISSLVILVAFEIVLNNHYLRPVNIIESIGSALSGIMLFGYLITKNNLFTLGFVVFAVVTLGQLRKVYTRTSQLAKAS